MGLGLGAVHRPRRRKTRRGRGEGAPIGFNSADPLESFRNDLGSIAFHRTPAAPGTGTSRTSPRQQVNTSSGYIDASNVYGVSRKRLDWLRAGRADGRPADNSAKLLLPAGYLPTASARGDFAAPPMQLMGPLAGHPGDAFVAGDGRANENIALAAIQTLFAREHNRVVAELPSGLPAEKRFQIARRVVNAEEQYVTYEQFLPALGVRLPRYRGYRPGLDAGIANEFAAVGFRAHSMVHGDFTIFVAGDTYSEAQLDYFRSIGIGVSSDGGSGVALLVPLTVAFGNPRLLREIGVGMMLRALTAERQYRNDEQIDDSLRSVLFQVPKPGIPDPTVCGAPTIEHDCFTVVQDLGAIDIQRGRDHGIPPYNALRRAYGLAPKRSFAAVTGEASDSFPADPAIDQADPINDPSILDFVELKDRYGNLVPPAPTATTAQGRRRTAVASRLRAVYGRLRRLDAFTGMLSEPHVPGTELGELQLAIWRRQFTALRDGDRFFYANDPWLGQIRRRYGITYRHSLAEIIGLDTGVVVQPDVFRFGTG